jgi:hypothetical protein
MQGKAHMKIVKERGLIKMERRLAAKRAAKSNAKKKKPQWGSEARRFSNLIVAFFALVAIQQSWVKHRPIEAAHERAKEQ